MSARAKPKWRKLHEGLNLQGTCENLKCEARGSDPTFAENAWSHWGRGTDGVFDYNADKNSVKCPVCKGSFVVCGFGLKGVWYKIDGAKYKVTGRASTPVDEPWVEADDRGDIKEFGVEELSEAWKELKIRWTKHDPNQPLPQTPDVPSREPEQFFLLIGIDQYYYTLDEGVKSNERDAAVVYTPLYGAVRDIKEIEKYIRNQKNFSFKDENIHTLLAKRPKGSQGKPYIKPIGDRSTWPTHDNIVAKFDLITKQAKPGDLVYIHYAGHGGSTMVTAFKALKGEGQRDESLVPCDIHMPDGKYILDLELAVYLDRMVKKELTVTVVLDCCHSSGATRDAMTDLSLVGATARGGSCVDRNPPPPAISPKEMWEHFSSKGVLGDGTRDAFRSFVKNKDGVFLMDSGDYELIAAARLDETAKEIDLGNPAARHGVLSYHYLQVLSEVGPEGITHGQMLARLQGMVNVKSYNQSPSLQGRPNRVLFGTRTILADKRPKVGVRANDANPGTVVINAGTAQAVCPGAEYYLFKWDDTERHVTNTTPRVIVTKSDELESIGKFVDGHQKLTPDQLANGQYCAVAVDPPAKPLKVYLEEKSPADQIQLQALRTELMKRTTNTPVNLVSKLDSADYCVQVDAGRHYSIYKYEKPWKFPIFTFPTGLRRDAEPFVNGLVHLARFDTIKNLKNAQTSTGGIDSNIDFKFVETISGTGLAGTGIIKDNGKTIDVISGSDIQVSFFNKYAVDSEQSVNVCIFNLTPGFGVDKLYPREAGSVDIIQPQSELQRDALQLNMCLPVDVKPPRMTTEYIMAVVYLDRKISTNFDALEQANMRDLVGGAPASRGSDALGKLFDNLRVPGRDANRVTRDPKPWQTMLLRVNVHPEGTTLP